MEEILSQKKVSDYEIEVETQPETPMPVKQTYDRTFLEKQLIDIQAQQNRDNEQREKEKAEVQAILGLCDKEGVITRAEEIK